MCRISEIAGARLKSNNPAIADLSDQNRPSKLAEKFSELYDNEWTDATEELKERKKKEKSTEKSEEEMEITVIKLFYEITKVVHQLFSCIINISNLEPAAVCMCE